MTRYPHFMYNDHLLSILHEHKLKLRDALFYIKADHIYHHVRTKVTNSYWSTFSHAAVVQSIREVLS